MAYQSKYTGLEIDDILDSVEWKQGKIEDLASIRAGAQKGATALQSYTEKYTGTVTGIKLNGVVKSGSGVIDLGTISTTETDPIFSASPAASITEAKKAEWDGKQDKIADLASIRSGAEKGATALQSIPSEYVTETELTNKGYATTSSLNNKVDKVNGKQLSTEDFTTALKTKLEGLSNYDDTELSNAVETLRGDFDNIVSGDTTTAIKTFNEVIAFLDGLTDTQDLESIIANIEQQIAGKMDKVTLATVATSGSYNDLSNKPTIPSAVTESTVSGWGFTKNAGTYSKPSTGIPKTDLASAVQTSLGKADTAVQPAAISDFIKGVAINGTTIANTSSTVYLPNASTGGYGVTRLNSNINSTSTMEAATPSAVKAAYDLANGKQDKLVSGTNIKTINGTSLLGSGNIEIESGGEANVQSDWTQEDAEDDSYIKNRTHYCYASTYIGQFVTVSKEVGDVLFEGLSEGVQYTILNNRNTSKNYSFQFVTGRKINIPFNGPTVEAVCSEDGSLVLASFTYGIAESFSVHFAEVKQLDDIYIPETIARTSELKTINGESIVGSGDLTISGGSSGGDGIVTKIEAIAPKNGALIFAGNELYPAIKANTIYVQETVSVASPLSVVCISAFEETTDVYVEYVLIFQTAQGAPQIILPDYVKWANGSIPTIEAYTTYELNIARSLLAGEATYCAVLTPFKSVE